MAGLLHHFFKLLFQQFPGWLRGIHEKKHGILGWLELTVSDVDPKLRAPAPKLYSKNGTHFAPPTGCKISPHQRSSKIIKKSSKDYLRSLISIHFHYHQQPIPTTPRHGGVRLHRLHRRHRGRNHRLDRRHRRLRRWRRGLGRAAAGAAGGIRFGHQRGLVPEEPTGRGILRAMLCYAKMWGIYVKDPRNFKG